MMVGIIDPYALVVFEGYAARTFYTSLAAAVGGDDGQAVKVVKSDQLLQVGLWIAGEFGELLLTREGEVKLAPATMEKMMDTRARVLKRAEHQKVDEATATQTDSSRSRHGPSRKWVNRMTSFSKRFRKAR